MKILDAGHKYKLATIDGDVEVILTFVKRDSPQELYSPNIGHYAGTTIQEVCRVLIDRLEYVQKQGHNAETDSVAIEKLRNVIQILETRAAMRHKRNSNFENYVDIEKYKVCQKCGHIHYPFCR